MYKVMIDYVQDGVIVPCDTQFDGDLIQSIIYVKEQNDKLERGHISAFQKFFLQKDGTKKWSFDGKCWAEDKTLCEDTNKTNHYKISVRAAP